MQNESISNTYSAFRETISGIPSRSILKPIYFNLPLGGIIFFIKTDSIEMFADYKTIFAWSQNSCS